MKKIISVFLIMLFGIILAGCSEYSDYTQYMYKTYIFNNELYEGISSFDEMKQFANNYQGGVVDAKHYDEDFFTSKSLIAFLLTEGSGGNRNKITSYTLEDRKLTINVKRTNVGHTADSAYWLVFFELSKEEYSQVSNVVINKDGKVYELDNVKTYETKMPEEMPDDFWIYLRVPYISYYSLTNTLYYKYDISSLPNKTELVLEKEQLEEIYKLLRDIKYDMYPEANFVSSKNSSGGFISLDIKGTGIQKSINLFETNIEVEDWICCKELGITLYSIFDEYIRSSEAYKDLQLTKKNN